MHQQHSIGLRQQQAALFLPAMPATALASLCTTKLWLAMQQQQRRRQQQHQQQQLHPAVVMLLVQLLLQLLLVQLVVEQCFWIWETWCQERWGSFG